ncbi:MAG: type II toxin-antitoxin system VapC family toxin [Gemmatimonadales bacterium]
MNLLLDTHIWLWSQLEPERLVAPVREALDRPDCELWLSPVSVWESLILVERGRIRVNGNPQGWIDQMLKASPIREAPVSFEVAAMSRRVELSHQDPADRFLAATAQVQALTLVTADERLLAGRGYQTLANR